MGLTELIMAAGLLGVLLAGVAFSRIYGKALGGGMAGDLAATTRTLFERTGYEHEELRGAPIEEQVARSVAQAGQTVQSSHLVRTVDGFEQHFEHAMRAAGAGWSTHLRWWTPAAPAFGLQVIDRSLTGAGQAVMGAVSNLKLDIPRVFETEVTPDDSTLAARFQCFTNDPERARRLLGVDDVARALHALHAVHFTVQRDHIALDDPTMKNLIDGRPAGALIGMSAEERMEAQLRGHEGVRRLFACVLPHVGA
jgi:hypothetical protein